MAPHAGFKLAVIRTMRCDTCNKGNVNGLQECVNCSMHFCRECIESGKLDNDEKHRLDQHAIQNLNWTKPPKGRRSAYHRETTTSEPVVSHAGPPKEERRQKRAERHHSRHESRHEARHDGTHHESMMPHLQGPRDPRVQQHMNPFLGSDFNVPAGHHEHAPYGDFQFAPAPPGYPPGYGPKMPAHAMSFIVPPFGPGQHPQHPQHPQQGQHPQHPQHPQQGQHGQHVQHVQHGQQPNQGGGLAMPMGPMYGQPFPVNLGPPPRGDPRIQTPPGQQYHHGGFAVPNNFGGHVGGPPLGYTPAPTPPNFPGPGFNQPPLQPPAMYNGMGYVPRGNIPTGQPVPGIGPGQATGHAPGQPHGGGVFPHAQPPQEHRGPREQEDEYADFIRFVRAAKLAEAAQASEPAPHGHAEQPVTLFTIQRQQQQRAWEQEQAQQVWEQQQAKQAWERQQKEQAVQQVWEQPQQQIKQQSVQPEAQQNQSEGWGEDETQPAAQQTSQAAQQAPKHDEQRQERREEQQSQQQAVRPIPEGGAASGPSPIAAPPIAAPPIAAPPIAAPPFTLPPIVAPRATASPITLPPINASPINAPPINAPLIAASSVQEAQTPVPAPAPAQAPRQPAPESDTTSQLSRLHLREDYLTPNVADQAQRPFGIPALARAFLAGLPNYYDETGARWSQCQPVRAKTIRDYDEDDYDDSDEHDHDATGTGSPRRPGPSPGRQPPPPPAPSNRGQKRTLHSRTPPADSTLSAELHQQPVAGASSGAAVVSRSHALHREREALDVMAAANTLTGGGRGLCGAADAQVVANDRVIRRRQEEIDQQLRRGADGGAVEPVMKKRRVEDGGGGVTGAEARGSYGGTSAGAGV